MDVARIHTIRQYSKTPPVLLYYPELTITIELCRMGRLTMSLDLDAYNHYFIKWVRVLWHTVDTRFGGNIAI